VEAIPIWPSPPDIEAIRTSVRKFWRGLQEQSYRPVVLARVLFNFVVDQQRCRDFSALTTTTPALRKEFYLITPASLKLTLA
jgi:hypothetical protein